MRQPPDWEFLAGDLAESRDARRRAGAGWRAEAWYIHQLAIAFITHFLFPARMRQAEVRSPMRNLMQDVRFASRLFASNKLFTAIAVLSLAVAIGASALVYGVVDSLVFNPFPFQDADRLVTIGTTFPKVDDEEGFIERHAPVEIEDYRRASSLANIAAFDLGNRSVSNGRDLSERCFTAFVLDDPFPALRQVPVLGRGFTREELAPDGPDVVILSHRVWRSLFQADPGIVGRSILVAGTSRTVVGVGPDGPLLYGTDIWVPWGGDPADVPRNQRQFTVIGRLAPGVAHETAEAELSAIASRIEHDHAAAFPEYQGWRVRVVPWAEALTGDSRRTAWLLLGAAAFVLLLACANLAGLLLARLGSRQREFGLRLALGSGRARLVRLLLVESLMLALAGGAIGVALAAAGLQAVTGLLPRQLTTLAPTVEVSGRLLMFSVAVSVLTAMVVVAIPAWQASRTDPQANLRDGVTHSGGRRRQRMRGALVVAEVVLAVMLLTGASLFLTSFIRLRQIDPGFEPKGVITMRLTLAQDRYPDHAATEFFNRLIERIESLPGVTAAAAATAFPPNQNLTSRFEIEGRAPDGGGALPNAFSTVVTPKYFDVIGLRLMSGRLLNDRDRQGGSQAVVVNRAFAERFLGGAMTGRLRFSSGGLTANGVWHDIVGVVSDARNASLTQPPRPEIFIPAGNAIGTYQLSVLARTAGDPMSTVPAIRSALAAMDPNQPLYNIQTLEAAMGAAVFQQRLTLILLQLFAVIALSLACVGVYGMVSFAVASRTREIGIRMALGASRPGVVRLIVKQSLVLVGIGTAIGLAGALALGKFIRRLLYQTTPADPAALLGVIVLLVLVALVAGYLPARRAGRLDPARALRME